MGTYPKQDNLDLLDPPLFIYSHLAPKYLNNLDYATYR
jgi:hypothetical protein